MKCPFCGHDEDKVIDSRSSEEGRSIRRRRECLPCHRRFTTYENIEEASLMVIKKDGRREPFDRKKILAGIKKACEKRPISTQKLEELADKIEYTLQSKFEKEVDASEAGELIMELLYDLDEVAYVRFASVYRQFKDINHFMKELKGLLNHK
ncbi:MAG: transcriptional regulator NrdR [Candidatus Omnitrophica bacterium]|nr:transcriptional regulator NrdR [Candidatus Omnitrophota bacterium]